MGSLSTTFLAEEEAFLMCAELLLVDNMIMARIHICSNSKEALAALAKTTTDSALVWEYMQA
jgi:hypothetical protein